MDTEQTVTTPAPSAAPTSPTTGEGQGGGESETVVRDCLTTLSKAGFDYDEKDIKRFVDSPLDLLQQVAGWVSKQGKSGGYRDIDRLLKDRRKSFSGPGIEKNVEVPEPRSYEGLLGK